MKTLHTLVHRLHNPDAGILFIRIALAAVFIYAGWFKVHNMAMVVSGFGAAGIPASLAYFVAYAELVCGLLMLIGLFARYAGILLAIIMLVAIVKVHGANGFSLVNSGYEYVLVLLLASLSIVTTGSGAYSVARMLKK